MTTRASPCLPEGFPRGLVKSLPDGRGLLVPGRRAHVHGSSFVGAGRHGAPYLQTPVFPPKMRSPVHAILCSLLALEGESETVSCHISSPGSMSPARSGTSGQTDSPLCLIMKPCHAPAVCTCPRERPPPPPVSRLNFTSNSEGLRPLPAPEEKLQSCVGRIYPLSRYASLMTALGREGSFELVELAPTRTAAQGRHAACV